MSVIIQFLIRTLANVTLEHVILTGRIQYFVTGRIQTVRRLSIPPPTKKIIRHEKYDYFAFFPMFNMKYLSHELI